MDNLELYNKLRNVPENALKPIEGGRMKGKYSIDPMWRIKMLTETFGPVGFGWKTKTIKKWIEIGANDEKSAFVDIELYISLDGKWSDEIEGSGGSSFVKKENKGFYTSDECFKMAYTDALSVACKSIGIGADVYFGNDTDKYSKLNESDLQKEYDHVRNEYEKLAENFKKLKEEYIKLSGNDKGKQKKSKSELREEFETKIQNILFLASGKKLENVPELLEKYSAFEKDGNCVAGEKDIKKLSDGRIQATYGKLQAVYPDIYTAVKETFEKRKKEAS